MQDILQKDERAWRSQLLKGTLELAVLLLLRRGRHYGLQIVDVLNGDIGLGISEGSIYPLLTRLRSEGKVKSEWVDDGVGHAHKYYDLTEQGRVACQGMLDAWHRHVQAFTRLMGED